MNMLKALSPWLLLIAVSSQALALDPNRQQQDKTLAFANSVLECAIYYEYTAGGLAKNPKVTSEVVLAIAEDAKTLLQTADKLYRAEGIAIEKKREEFMQRAETLLKQRQASPEGVDQLIYEFGEKCRVLLSTYSYRIKSLSSQLDSI